MSTGFPAFAVACGEEGSDPLVVHEGEVVRVDEYAASAHLEHLDADLGDVAALGVTVWRYGMPWRLAEPEPGTYDWTLWDRALAACDRHGLQPVIDLCHFGLPDHYAGFCDPAWVEGFARYTDAFLARYREPVWFTPVNEPGITALFSARFGMWNDRRASDDDYFVALGNLALANLEAVARVQADRDGWWIGSEGFGCEVADPDDPVGIERATAARDMSWAVWDLHLGIAPRGAAERMGDVVPHVVQTRIATLASDLDRARVVAGHDIYPVSVATHGSRRERPLAVDDRVARVRGGGRRVVRALPAPLLGCGDLQPRPRRRRRDHLAGRPHGRPRPLGRAGAAGARHLLALAMDRARVPNGWTHRTAAATSTTGTRPSPRPSAASPRWACSTPPAEPARWHPPSRRWPASEQHRRPDGQPAQSRAPSQG